MQATIETVETHTESAAIFGPNLLLRIEGLTLFAASAIAYTYLHGNGWIFAALFLAPDLVAFAYLAGIRTGTQAYNIVHHPLLPGIMIGLALATGAQTALLLGLIWMAHIGMDRAAGYGFKYPLEGKHTHLQRV